MRVLLYLRHAQVEQYRRLTLHSTMQKLLKKLFRVVRTCITFQCIKPNVIKKNESITTMITIPTRHLTFCGDMITKKVDEMIKSQDGYLFRGQSQAKWHAQPSAFRSNEVKDICNQLLPIDKNSFIAYLWENRGLWIPNFSSDSNCRISSPHDFFRSAYMNLNKQWYPVENHVTWAMWSLGYLKHLTKHYSRYKDTIFQENKDYPRIKTLLLERKHTEDNIKKIMLNSFIMNVMCSMKRYSLQDGKKLDFGGKVDEPPAPLPESYLQHYVTSTCAIDFTSDPLVALYFSLTEKNNWIDIEDNRTRKVALYKIKVCSDCSNFEIADDSDKLSIVNKRKKAQNGTILRIKNSHEYYLLNGEFPTLERVKHEKPCACCIEKNIFKICSKILPLLKKKLEENEISNEKLFPPSVI